MFWSIVGGIFVGAFALVALVALFFPSRRKYMEQEECGEEAAN